MANVTANTGTYAGKLALPYVKPAILAADTIVNNWCAVRPNVVGTSVLRKFDGSTIRDRTCGFVGGAGTLTEVILATKGVEIKLELCHDDLIATWEADLMTDSRFAPADTKEAMLQYIVEQAAEDVEKNLWSGLYNSTNQSTTGGTALAGFGGFTRQIVAAGAAIGNDDALTGATTAANILTRLADLVGGAPSYLFGESDAYIYMSPAMKQLYYQAMSTTHGPVLGEMVNSYAGVPIVTPRGMANDTFVFTTARNLVFGTDLTGNDFATQAGVVDLNESTLEDVVRGMIAFTAGTAIIDPGAVSFAGRTS
jgi:hypothetical protein